MNNIRFRAWHKELKPCPCGYDSPLLHSEGIGVLVECIMCGQPTEVFEDTDEGCLKAISRWNNIVDTITIAKEYMKTISPENIEKIGIENALEKGVELIKKDKAFMNWMKDHGKNK